MSTHASKVEALSSGETERKRDVQIASGRNSTTTVLEQVSAAYLDSAMSARQAIWNLGRDQFEGPASHYRELYSDLDRFADAFAAELVTRGAIPPGTVHILATLTSLPPFPAELTGKQDLSEALSLRTKQVAKLTRRAIAAFDHPDDAEIVDLLAEASSKVEKHSRLLEKHAQPT